MWAQRAKRFVLEHATELPVSVASALAALNRDPMRVYGRAYAAYRARLAATESHHDNTADTLRIVNHALARVPYYRDRYGSVEVHSLDEMRARIGFVDRDEVGKHAGDFIDPQIERAEYDECTTGGTSGRPLAFLAPKRRYVVEHATMHALWARAGYRFDMRAVIRNHRLAGQPYVVNPITREVIFDGFALDSPSLSRALDIILRRELRFIHCYPSTAYELARVMERRGITGRGLTFLSGSENIYPHQRALIEDTLGARFYNWYGHSEKLVLAGYCAATSAYHVEPTYGFFELVDDRGEAVTAPGATGEIVGTTLHNPGMPLIRYRTGDLATYVGDHCDACGRLLPVFRDVRGRWNGDRIYRADGGFVTTTALNLHDELNRAIQGLQYVQERAGELVVLVIKGPSFTATHGERLQRHFVDKLSPADRVEIRFVDQLRRLPNGKFSHLMSSVDAR
ncbi:MAG TPA: hypothetical protein VLT45_11000 [Kofleriaceae bacterium]|nr:hypothetical protein [Kofleriaceae bacterium]